MLLALVRLLVSAHPAMAGVPVQLPPSEPEGR